MKNGVFWESKINEKTDGYIKITGKFSNEIVGIFNTEFKIGLSISASLGGKVEIDISLTDKKIVGVYKLMVFGKDLSDTKVELDVAKKRFEEIVKEKNQYDEVLTHTFNSLKESIKRNMIFTMESVSSIENYVEQTYTTHLVATKMQSRINDLLIEANRKVARIFYFNSKIENYIRDIKRIQSEIIRKKSNINTKIKEIKSFSRKLKEHKQEIANKTTTAEKIKYTLESINWEGLIMIEEG
ncbi:hypothetical protein [Nautilia lithotrophica]